MALHLNSIGAAVVVSLSGRFMTGTERAELRNVVQDMIDQGCRKVVLDLSSLHTINSTGIGSVVACYTMVKNNSGDLTLAGLSGRVKDCFTMTGLYKVMEIFSTTEEAVGHLDR